jgi:ORF6N domain
VNLLPKLASGQRPNVIDLMKSKDMALVANRPSGKGRCEDEVRIRTAVMRNPIPTMTALRATHAPQGSEVQVPDVARVSLVSRGGRDWRPPVRQTMKPRKSIDSIILSVRGQRVILDPDLGDVDAVTTNRLNEAAKRNADRLPKDFAIRLTGEEQRGSHKQ